MNPGVPGASARAAGGPRRPACPRCRRPGAECLCAELRPVENRVPVVFVQHPREARVPISTCRLAHLSLPTSELHVALRAEGSPRLEGLAATPGTWVLFPGPGAVDAASLPAPPDALVVVDGTWINARKLIERSPLLAALPRVGFAPARPSTYRIRREPRPECLSTIEAVAHVLGVIEGEPDRYTPILRPFDALVARQLDHLARGVAAQRPRHVRAPGLAARLAALADRLVLVAVEVHPAPPGGVGQRLRWAGLRLRDGARFEVVVGLPVVVSPHRPRRERLADDVRGLPPAEAAARWRRFVDDDAVVAAWGRGPARFLGAAGLLPAPPLDLKPVVSNLHHGPGGGVERLAARVGDAGDVDDAGEAGGGVAARQLDAVAVVVRAAVAGRAGSGGVR